MTARETRRVECRRFMKVLPDEFQGRRDDRLLGREVTDFLERSPSYTSFVG